MKQQVDQIPKRYKVVALNKMLDQGYRVYNTGGKIPYLFWLDIYSHEWFPNLIFVKTKPDN